MAAVIEGVLSLSLPVNFFQPITVRGNRHLCPICQALADGGCANVTRYVGGEAFDIDCQLPRYRRTVNAKRLQRMAS